MINQDNLEKIINQPEEKGVFRTVKNWVGGALLTGGLLLGAYLPGCTQQSHHNQSQQDTTIPVVVQPKDTTPPGDVSKLTATAGDSLINLNWTNPVDEDFEGVMILRKTDSFPTDQNDGIFIYSGEGQSHQDSGLDEEVNYFYKIFSYDAIPNFSSGAVVLSQLPDTTPPGEVSDFIVTTGDHQIDLTWTNPKDSDFKGVMIRRKTDSFPTDPNDGVFIYSGIEQSHQDSELEEEINYFYKIFTYDEIPNHSSGEVVLTQLPDTTPPGEVSNLTATAGDSLINLNWTNPVDEDFEGVMILRKTDSFPTDQNDGTLIYTGTEESYEDLGLEEKIIYHYKIFTYDEIPNHSSGSVILAEAQAGETDIPLTFIEKTSTNLPIGPDSSFGCDFADIDNDGDLDFITVNSNAYKIYKNNGLGCFSVDTTLSGSGYSGNMEFGDVDGDGDIDFVAARMGANASGVPNSVFINDGFGKFTQYWSTPEADHTTNVCLSDLDGDMDLDFVAINSSDEPYFRIYKNNGSGNFTLDQTCLNSSGHANGCLADIDGDGDKDLILTRHNGATPLTNLIYTNNGLGKFTQFSTSLENECTRCAIAGDFDQDGDVDFIVGNANTHPIRLYTNDGNGNFTSTWTSLTSNPVDSLDTYDIDNDGDLDVLAHGGDIGGASTPTRIWLNDGSGKFIQGWSNTMIGRWQAKFADVDGDNDMDVYITSENIQNQLFIKE